MRKRQFYQVGDVVLYWVEDPGDRWVGIVTDLDEDSDPVLLWRNVDTGKWADPHVTVSPRMTNLGPLPKGVEWDV